ncbi:MAG: EAL domain-containing protein [Gammaproteobacteria bacterium]|nr:EAL domain-containing protein [Gammaproteobacteria bacterium]
MNLSFLNKFKIRAKLLLLLFLPVCVLLYLSTFQILLKKSIIEENEEIIHFMEISQSLTSIIYELQLERDFTGESLFGSELAPEHLNLLYSNTDRKFMGLLSIVNDDSYSDFDTHQHHSKLNQLINTLMELPALRQKVKEYEHDKDKSSISYNKFFDEYTQYINDIILFIKSIRVISTDNELLHKVNSYINLLQAQEYAGQERSILNTIFLRGEMAVDTYQIVVSIISQQKNYLKQFYLENVDGSGQELKQQLNTKKSKDMLLLRHAGLEKARKTELLYQIQSVIGYGGLIHDFKNYVMRANSEYRARFESDMGKFRLLIAEYNNLSGMSKKESQFLNVIVKTLNKYHSMLSIIGQMREDGASIEEIDRTVIINDNPAKLAFKLLSTYVTGLESGEWLPLATARINIMRTHAVDLEINIINHGKQLHKIISLNLVQHIVFISLILFTLIFISTLLIRRLVVEVSSMTNKIEVMQETGRFDQFLEVRGGDEIALMANAFDDLISQQKAYQNHMWHQAYYDELTGLANRKLCIKKIKEEIERSARSDRPFAVLFIDLDRFKIINDSLGHHIGDDLLCQAANRLSKVTRHTDFLVRLGGDEFVIILTEIDDEQSVKVVTLNVLQTLNERFILIESHQAVISASIGIAMCPADSCSVDGLLKKADTAMYQAKDNGKNQYQFFTKEMNNRVINSMQVEQDLHTALEYQQFELYYQPIFNLKTNKIASVEALIRWNRTDGNLVFPDDFIPIAEETGLIVPMGKWIFLEAMQQIKDWNLRCESSIKMAINVSTRQFSDRNMPILDLIKGSLEKTGLGAENIEIEITENLLMENSPLLGKILNQLSQMRIKILMDDFGTGYSSLSYLKKFPIDVLKIDRSFVWNMDKDEGDKRLVTSIINMAKSMELTVLAEGVETQKHESILKELGCDLAQGYLYTKPLSASEFEKQFLE